MLYLDLHLSLHTCRSTRLTQIQVNHSPCISLSHFVCIIIESYGSKISNSPSNKSDKSRDWFTFKFNTVKFDIVDLQDLRKHKHVANKNI